MSVVVSPLTSAGPSANNRIKEFAEEQLAEANAKVNVLEERVAGLTNAVTKLEGENTDLKGLVADLESQLAVADRQKGELTAANARVGELKGQLADLKSQLDDANRMKGELTAVNDAKVGALERQVAELKFQLARVKDHIGKKEFNVMTGAGDERETYNPDDDSLATTVNGTGSEIELGGHPSTSTDSTNQRRVDSSMKDEDVLVSPLTSGEPSANNRASSGVDDGAPGLKPDEVVAKETTPSASNTNGDNSAFDSGGVSTAASENRTSTNSSALTNGNNHLHDEDEAGQVTLGGGVDNMKGDLTETWDSPANRQLIDKNRKLIDLLSKFN